MASDERDPADDDDWRGEADPADDDDWRGEADPADDDDDALDERVVVDLEPDGRGRLLLDRRTRGELGALLLLSAARDPEPDPGDLAREEARYLAKHLSRWSGVAAWTDLEAVVEPGEWVRLRATGWFEDVDAVVEATGGLSVCLRRRTDGPELVVQRVEERGPPLREGVERLLDDATGPGFVSRYAERVNGLGQVSHEWSFLLPSAPTRTALVVRLDLDEKLARARHLDDLATDLRDRIARRALSRADAARELEATLADMGTLEARCPASAVSADPEAARAFSDALERARALWRASPIAAEATKVATRRARSPTAWLEDAAAGCLKLLETAQLLFFARQDDGERTPVFAASLDELLASDLIDPELASGKKHGHAFELHRSSSRPGERWLAVARPLSEELPGQVLVVNHEGGGVHACPPSAAIDRDTCELPSGAQPRE